MSSSDQSMFSRSFLCHGQLLILKLLGLDSKIDLLDPPETISKKILKAEAAPRVVEDNSLIALVEFIFLSAAGPRGPERISSKAQRYRALDIYRYQAAEG